MSQCVGSDTFDFQDAATKIESVSSQLELITQALGPDGFDVSKLAKIVKTATPFLQMLGPAFGILAVITPAADSDEIKLMKREFGRLNSRLDSIEQSIEDLVHNVESVAVYTDYKKQRDILGQIRLRAQRFLLHPEAARRQELRRECERHSALHVIGWIHQRVTKPRLPPMLIPAVINHVKYHRREFVKFVKLVVADVTEAIVLQATCAGVAEPQESPAARNQTSASISKQMGEIVQELERGERTLKDEAIPTRLKKDMLKQMKEKEALGHQEFADGLCKNLKDSFDWLDWSVFSYKPVAGWEYHAMRGPAYEHVFREFGRNLVVSWAPKTGPLRGATLDEMKTGLSKMPEDCHSGDTALTHLNNLEDKLTRLPSLMLFSRQANALAGAFNSSRGGLLEYKCKPTNAIVCSQYSCSQPSTDKFVVAIHT
jgi:hypothetical protein